MSHLVQLRLRFWPDRSKINCRKSEKSKKDLTFDWCYALKQQYMLRTHRIKTNYKTYRTRQAEYEDHMDQITLVVLCMDNAVWRHHPGYLFPGPVFMVFMETTWQEAFLGFCAQSEGPCPRSWSKSTAFAMTNLGSRDAYVYTRPVSRGSWGFWRPPPPNFQKFTNLEAVIHSVLQLSLIVQRKQW